MGKSPREMAVTGDYVTPRLNGVKYFEKPPLVYWLSALTFRQFGVSKFTVRLWGGIFSAIGVLLTYATGRALHGRAAGIWSAIVLSTMLMYYVFSQTSVPFDYAERRSGHSKFRFASLFDLAMTGLTSFSSFPLRIWVGVGSVISGLSMMYALYIMIRTLIYGTDVPGWATLVVAITFLGGIQLLSIGILGEYVARIFTEVKRRPGYVVSERHRFPYEEQKA